MMPWISKHAVHQYRARVVGCPERLRSDRVLLHAMLKQIGLLRPRSAGGNTAVYEVGSRQYPLYTFVCERWTIVTVLGFMMRSKPTRNKKRAEAKLAAAKMQAFIDGVSP